MALESGGGFGDSAGTGEIASGEVGPTVGEIAEALAGMFGDLGGGFLGGDPTGADLGLNLASSDTDNAVTMPGDQAGFDPEINLMGGNTGINVAAQFGQGGEHSGASPGAFGNPIAAGTTSSPSLESIMAATDATEQNANLGNMLGTAMAPTATAFGDPTAVAGSGPTAGDLSNAVASAVAAYNAGNFLGGDAVGGFPGVPGTAVAGNDAATGVTAPTASSAFSGLSLAEILSAVTDALGLTNVSGPQEVNTAGKGDLGVSPQGVNVASKGDSASFDPTQPGWDLGNPPAPTAPTSQVANTDIQSDLETISAPTVSSPTASNAISAGHFGEFNAPGGFPAVPGQAPAAQVANVPAEVVAPAPTAAPTTAGVPGADPGSTTAPTAAPTVAGVPGIDPGAVANPNVSIAGGTGTSSPSIGETLGSPGFAGGPGDPWLDLLRLLYPVDNSFTLGDIGTPASGPAGAPQKTFTVGGVGGTPTRPAI